MKETVKFIEESTSLCACLLCEIDHHTAKDIRERIDLRLRAQRPKTFVLDFSEVRFMDSSGIGLILGRSEVCDNIGAHVRLVGMSPLLIKLVKLSGIDRIKNLSIVM